MRIWVQLLFPGSGIILVFAISIPAIILLATVAPRQARRHILYNGHHHYGESKVPGDRKWLCYPRGRTSENACSGGCTDAAEAFLGAICVAEHLKMCEYLQAGVYWQACMNR